MLALWKLPFLLHVAIESAAIYFFAIRPELQLSAKDCSPEASLVFRQYAALLASSNIICLAVILQPEHSLLSRHIALALVVYHVFPCHRAWVRMQGAKATGQDSRSVPLIKRPQAHLVAHVACCMTFVATSCW